MISWAFLTKSLFPLEFVWCVLEAAAAPPLLAWLRVCWDWEWCYFFRLRLRRCLSFEELARWMVGPITPLSSGDLSSPLLPDTLWVFNDGYSILYLDLSLFWKSTFRLFLTLFYEKKLYPWSPASSIWIFGAKYFVWVAWCGVRPFIWFCRLCFLMPFVICATSWLLFLEEIILKLYLFVDPIWWFFYPN